MKTNDIKPRPEIMATPPITQNEPDQITIRPFPPEEAKMQPVKNPCLPKRDIRQWILSGGYRGNKPYGGLWTSTYTPDDPDGFRCDWQRGVRMNALIKAGYAEIRAFWPGWRLQAVPDAKVLAILKFEDALAFTKHYHLASFEFPSSVDLSQFLTAEITNWEEVFRDYDCIRLTDEACDEITCAKVFFGGQTAFDTWNCESSLWGKWRFKVGERIRAMDHAHFTTQCVNHETEVNSQGAAGRHGIIPEMTQ